MPALWVPAFDDVTARGHWCRAAIRSQRNVTYRHGSASGFEVDLAIRRCLHRRDQRLTGGPSLEATELLRCNNDDFVAPVHGDVLRSLATDFAHNLAEARFGVLKNPKSGARLPYPCFARRFPVFRAAKPRFSSST